jgi:hypothetical protein
MSITRPVSTNAEQPRKAVLEIFENLRQFTDLTVASGETLTIPSDEVWYVSGDVTVEGDLIINGELVNGTVWTHGEPVVEKYENTSIKAKNNRTETALYIHKPASDGIDRFSASQDPLLEQTDTVRLTIWYLGEASDTPPSDEIARQYRDDIIDIARTYMNDNFTETTFHNLEPTDSTDFRHQNITRQTDHYIYGVTVETDRLT